MQLQALDVVVVGLGLGVGVGVVDLVFFLEKSSPFILLILGGNQIWVTTHVVMITRPLITHPTAENNQIQPNFPKQPSVHSY